MPPMQSRSSTLPPPSALPLPGAADLALSARLAEHLIGRIAAHDGWLSFAAFMEACLYTPGLGYYNNAVTKLGTGLGDASDFVTAPELSSLFGRALAQQVAEINAASGATVLEFGAGSGKLACDVLAELERLDALPERYLILDLSADLQHRQRALLAQRLPHLLARVSWLERLPDAIRGTVLANEVLDAMPVHSMVWTGTAWHERGVCLAADGRLAWADRPASAALTAAMAARVDAHALSPGYLTELNLAAPAFIGSVAERLQSGALLLIDYGFPAAEYFHAQRQQGTLMAHYRHHAHHDLLAWPGLQDLTAHVDFTAIAQAAVDAGLALLGYTSQANFLINCGIAELLQGDPQDAAAWLPQVNALQRLMSEAEMGELFKVIGLGRNLPASLRGFRRGDRTHTL